MKVKQPTGKLARLALYNNSFVGESLLSSLKWKTYPGAGRQARAADGRIRRANIFRPRSDSVSTRSRGRLYRRRERPTCVPPPCFDTMQLVCPSFTPFSFWKTSIESEQCHSNRRLFIIFIFWRKKVKNQPIFSSWDKSDAVDGSHILITLASIRRRGFLSRTKNVFYWTQVTLGSGLYGSRPLWERFLRLN